jgi:Arc/MetJ-type ribon-helix-helix transcriptional regulator
MNTKRTHIVIPQQLVAEIDTLVGKRGRSAFLTQAAEKELMRLRQIKALESAAGSWKDKDHPELKEGAAKWVKKLRQEYDQRFEKMTRR